MGLAPLMSVTPVVHSETWPWTNACSRKGAAPGCKNKKQKTNTPHQQLEVLVSSLHSVSVLVEPVLEVFTTSLANARLTMLCPLCAKRIMPMTASSLESETYVKQLHKVSSREDISGVQYMRERGRVSHSGPVLGLWKAHGCLGIRSSP